MGKALVGFLLERKWKRELTFNGRVRKNGHFVNGGWLLTLLESLGRHQRFRILLQYWNVGREHQNNYFRFQSLILFNLLLLFFSAQIEPAFQNLYHYQRMQVSMFEFFSLSHADKVFAKKPLRAGSSLFLWSLPCFMPF